MFTSKRWITGIEAQATLDITGVELLGMVEQGLPVYDQHGRPSSYKELGWSSFGNPPKTITVSLKPRAPSLGLVYPENIRLANIELARFKTEEVEAFINEKELPCKKMASSPPVAEDFSIKVPDGTKWENIHLRVPNKDFLEIRYPGGGMANIEVKDLPFQGYGSDYGELWLMVLDLAVRGGEIAADPNRKQHISRLRKKIQQIIPGVDGNPIRHNRKRKIYKTTFSISGDAKELLNQEL